MRRLFTLISALSLLICVATMVLWVLGFFREIRVSRHVHGTRYTAVSGEGYLVVTGPPPNRASAELTALVEKIRNDQIRWFTRGNLDVDPRPEGWPDTATQQLCDAARPSGPHRVLPQSAPPAPIGPLLAALEDPERGLAAHLVLRRLADPDGTDDSPFKWTRVRFDGSGTYAGLAVHLSAVSIPRLPIFHDTIIEYRAQIDPAQFPAIRERWHRKFDEPFWSVAYWKPTAALLILPLVWALVAISRLIRRDVNAARGTGPEDRPATGGRAIHRLARVSFLACAAVSLMIAAGITYLWKTSYPQRYGVWRFETINGGEWSYDEMAWAIDRGTFQYSREIQEPPKPESSLTQEERVYLSSHRVVMWDGPRNTDHPALKLTFTVGGFLLWTIPAKEGQDGRHYTRDVIIPLWFPLLLALILPVRAVPVVCLMWRGRAARPHGKQGFAPVPADSRPSAVLTTRGECATAAPPSTEDLKLGRT